MDTTEPIKTNAEVLREIAEDVRKIRTTLQNSLVLTILVFIMVIPLLLLR